MMVRDRTARDEPHRSARHAGGVLLACIWAFIAAGCGASDGDRTPGAAPAPVMLTPKRAEGSGPAQPVYAGSLDQAELTKAIERYRITKNRGPAAFDVGAADLNGDGRPEALVLFTGDDWCSPTGCSLVIFQPQEFGYRPVSHVVSVRPPVLLPPAQGGIWRDLIVRTGGGAAPERTVRLAFSSKGYAANALIQPDADSESVSQSARLIAGSGLPSGEPPQTPGMARNP